MRCAMPDGKINANGAISGNSAGFELTEDDPVDSIDIEHYLVIGHKRVVLARAE